jgi:restriction system protein
MKQRDGFHTAGAFLLQGSFRGRVQELGRLDKCLRDGPNTVIVVGLGGSGKTSLALEFAKRNRAIFKDNVLHLSVSELGVRDVSLRPRDRQLVIWDDFEQSHDPTIETAVRDLAQRFPLSMHLILSRRRFQISLADQLIELGPLPESDVHELLNSSPVALNEEDFKFVATLSGGNPRTVLELLSMLAPGNYSKEQLQTGLVAFESGGLFSPTGKLMDEKEEGYQRIVSHVAQANDDLLAKIEGNPKLLYDISPREFEDLIASVLKKMGYSIRQTKLTRDGGKDIYAAINDPLGKFLYVVECKRYGPRDHIGVGIVRSLYGVVQAERATAGVLVTSSFFTKPAIEFQQQVGNQLTLRDYIEVQNWIKEIRTA